VQPELVLPSTPNPGSTWCIQIPGNKFKSLTYSVGMTAILLSKNHFTHPLFDLLQASCATADAWFFFSVDCLS
jgi:hypothetical protein